MRLYWNHVWRSQAYRQATADERRLIDLRFSLSRTLHRLRTDAGINQVELARRIGVAQATVSRAERASNCVSLDITVRCLIALGCTDSEIAKAFDVSRDPRVQKLRAAARRPLYSTARKRPGAEPRSEHRFLKKGTEVLQRLR